MSSISSYDLYLSSLNGEWEWKGAYKWHKYEQSTNQEIDRKILQKWKEIKDSRLKKDQSFSFTFETGTFFTKPTNINIYRCNVRLDYGRKKITKIKQINQNSNYIRNMRRIPQFQFPTGNKNKLESLFSKCYANPQEPSIMSEIGIIKFCKHCAIDTESHEALIISYHLNCAALGIYETDEFAAGFYKHGCSNKSDIKKCVQSICNVVNNNEKRYKIFYRWCFEPAKVTPHHKKISIDFVKELWRILFTPKRMKMRYLAEWNEYIDIHKEDELKWVGRDLWNQIYDFLMQTDDINNYDKAGDSWPVIIDDFIKYLQENEEKNQGTKRTIYELEIDESNQPSMKRQRIN